MKLKNTVEWYYEKEADLTIGETKASKIAKVLLIGLIIILTITLAVSIYFRNYLYAYVVNPGMILPNKEITLEVNSTFEPAKYVIIDNKVTETVLPKPEDVDMKKLGSYEVQYTSKNAYRENNYLLKINVVDKTKPKIELTSDLVVLTRGVDTDKFKAAEYVKSYSDNYDKKEDLKLTYTENLNFDKSSLDVVYLVKDKSGNEVTSKLKIIINDKPEETTPTTKHTQAAQPAPQQPTPQQPTPQQPAPHPPPAPPAQPFINGVHNVTVAVGTDFNSFVNQLISGVYGSGYVSCDYSSVNLTVPGTYTATFSSDDGVTKTATVIVQ